MRVECEYGERGRERVWGCQRRQTLLHHLLVDIQDILGLDKLGLLLECGKSVPNAVLVSGIGASG